MPPVIAHFQFQYELDTIRSISPDTNLPEVLYHKDGPLAYVTLNRPERRNAFNDALYVGLFGGLHRALLDDKVRVVVIRGAGMGFSSGHDLTSPMKPNGEPEETPPVMPRPRPTVTDYFNLEHRRCQKYEEIVGYPKIVIAQVHGFCIGAGAFVQSACDFTYAADNAQFGTHAFGHSVTGIASIEAVWPGRSQVIKGVVDAMAAVEAVKRGLINGVFPPEQLEEEVRAIGLKLAEMPAEAVARTKQWYTHLWETAGLGLAYRAHYHGHTGAQWTKFKPGEVNFYKTRGEQSLRGYFGERSNATTAVKT